MQSVHAELVAIVDAKCVVGEGPVWDERLEALWFTDIQQSQLLSYDWNSGRLTRYDLPERLGSFGITADPGRLVCAFASGFALYAPESGTCKWLVKTEPYYRGLRMNDGRIDRAGRLWAGSMVENSALAGDATGALYRLDPGEQPSASWMFDGIAISNSISFSPDGSRLYFADTPTREIRIYPCDDADDEIGPGALFARVSGSGVPDGSDVDADGRLWNAEWGSGRVAVYEPNGSIHGVINLPISQATCPAFGGPALDHLFVTTAREGLSPMRLAAEPHAGDLFIYRTPYRGLNAPRFGGSGELPA